MELTPDQRQITGLSKRLGGDSNPVIYSLKKEGGWHFKNQTDENEFWRIFKYNLRCFLREHKNEFETAILVPSSNRLNKKIMKSIEEIAAEVAELVSREMENVAQLRVPLTAEAKYGKSWYEAK